MQDHHDLGWAKEVTKDMDELGVTVEDRNTPRNPRNRPTVGGRRQNTTMFREWKRQETKKLSVVRRRRNNLKTSARGNSVV